MAETKKRTYNVPLRRKTQKSPTRKRAKKASKVLREFLQKHMKTENVKIGVKANEQIWARGIKKPPHHIKVDVELKDGVAVAELHGIKTEEVLPEPTKADKKAEAKKEEKAEVKTETVEKKESPKTPAEKTVKKTISKKKIVKKAVKKK
ncbi:50S ribosomal protein L31e [Candidatus Woesearchaeota archaeon]|nr:50S ribosomal protein L31e [Candidatus Woesearchaeota archaeon]